MAITIQAAPEPYSRVYDTNTVNYYISSSEYTKPNFMLGITLDKYDLQNTGITTNIGTFKMHTDSTGKVVFNPTSVLKNYLNYDFNISATTFAPTACDNSFGLFRLTGAEYWYSSGTTPNTRSQILGDITLYNGCQQFIGYNTEAGGLNTQWVMRSSTLSARPGKYLTDITNNWMDSDEYAFLYYIAQLTTKPTKMVVTYYYMSTGEVAVEDPPVTDGLTIGGGDPIIGNERWTNAETNEQPSAMRPVINMEEWSGNTITNTGNTIGWVTPTIRPHLTKGTNTITLNYPAGNHYMWYIPAGPKQLLANNYIHPQWKYYTIDLFYNTTRSNTLSYTVFRKIKCEKYGKYQLFWLNSHGGFDTYTFNKKNDINYSITKSMYNQRLQPNYSYSTAGERVFYTDVQEQITLRTDTLTQLESQSLMGLVQSPVVYLIKTYLHGGNQVIPYSVPYIVMDDKVKYEQKRNDKEITMEVTIRPAYSKIIQQD